MESFLSCGFVTLIITGIYHAATRLCHGTDIEKNSMENIQMQWYQLEKTVSSMYANQQNEIEKRKAILYSATTKSNRQWHYY